MTLAAAALLADMLVIGSLPTPAFQLVGDLSQPGLDISRVSKLKVFCQQKPVPSPLTVNGSYGCISAGYPLKKKICRTVDIHTYLVITLRCLVHVVAVQTRTIADIRHDDTFGEGSETPLIAVASAAAGCAGFSQEHVCHACCLLVWVFPLELDHLSPAILVDYPGGQQPLQFLCC